MRSGDRGPVAESTNGVPRLTVRLSKARTFDPDRSAMKGERPIAPSIFVLSTTIRLPAGSQAA